MLRKRLRTGHKKNASCARLVESFLRKIWWPSCNWSRLQQGFIWNIPHCFFMRSSSILSRHLPVSSSAPSRPTVLVFLLEKLHRYRRGNLPFPVYRNHKREKIHFIWGCFPNFCSPFWILRLSKVSVSSRPALSTWIFRHRIRQLDKFSRNAPICRSRIFLKPW